jgi:hypothetical protein
MTHQTDASITSTNVNKNEILEHVSPSSEQPISKDSDQTKKTDDNLDDTKISATTILVQEITELINRNDIFETLHLQQEMYETRNNKNLQFFCELFVNYD